MPSFRPCWTTTATKPGEPDHWACPGPRSTERSTSTASSPPPADRRAPPILAFHSDGLGQRQNRQASQLLPPDTTGEALPPRPARSGPARVLNRASHSRLTRVFLHEARSLNYRKNC